MTEETRPPLNLDSEVPQDGNPTPSTPIAVESSAKSTRARRRRTPDLPPPKAERPGLFSPSVFYALGALVTAVTLLTHLNPRSPVIGERALWPWQLFRSDFAAGGDPVFRWSFAHAVALVLAVVILYYLIASLLRTSHARGAAALLLTLLAVVLFWPGDPAPLTYGVGLIAALAAGAVLLRYDGRRLARGVLFVGTILLGALLFFPSLEAADLGYRPQILTLVEPFKDFARGDLPFGMKRMVSGDGLHVLLLFALAVLGLLAAFGVRRRWVKIAGGIVLLLTIILPLLATQLFDLDDARPPELDVLGVLNQSFWVWTLGLASVFVAASASLLGVGGRWATWLAGTALLLLAFDQPATVFREAAGVPGAVDPAGLAIVALGQHLGRGALVAFILPVTALVMDLARPRA